jgi:2',3'-cyclic-nucleotide 2'-phosphodiesterase (5'-nucleotidase family)
MTTLCLVDKQLVKKSAQLLKVSDHKGIDQGLQTLLEKYNDNKELNTVIGKALNDISGKDELGCLMTDGMAAVAPVEIAFQNNGGIRVDKILQGDITIKDIYKLDPFGNEIVLFKLNASEIKELIISSFNRDKSIDLQVSGITYSIVQNEAGQATDAIIIMSNGKPIDLNKDYNVGMSSYIASSYDFSKRDQGTSLYITTAQSLINFIKEKKEVDYKGFKRAKTEKAE